MFAEAVKVIKNNCLDYMAISSIHGPRFLTEPNRPKVEKVFWFIMIVFTVFGCGLLIADIWIKYEENPLVMAIDEKATPVWQIPFPAVTICSEAKTDQNLLNISQFLGPFLDRQSKKIHSNISQLFDDVDRSVQ
jgi:acid-sensing ion channel, other